jgi:hypothetical protein
MTTAACPRCGGTQARALAPNYYECENDVLADVVPAGMQGNVSDVPIYRPCGHRFQTGAAAAAPAQCACGMFAIGACVECGSPLCGQHGVMREGRLLCGPHAQKAADAANALATTAQQQREDEWRAATAEWEAHAVAALNAIPDPVERLVRAVVEIRAAQTSALQRMIPKKWKDREIADWFLRAVRGRPTHPKMLVYEKGLFGTRERRRPGWNFSQGSRSEKQYPHGHRQLGSIAVMQDGRIYYDRSFEPDRDDGFSEKALAEMVKLARLKPLQLPPRPKSPTSGSVYFA